MDGKRFCKICNLCLCTIFTDKTRVKYKGRENGSKVLLQRLQSVSFYYFLQIKPGLEDKGEVEGKCFCKNCNQGLVD